MADRPPMVSRMAVAVYRFTPNPMFRAATMPDAPLRSTRPEAVADEVAWRARSAAPSHADAPPCEPGDYMCVDGWPCPVHDYHPKKGSSDA